MDLMILLPYGTLSDNPHQSLPTKRASSIHLPQTRRAFGANAAVATLTEDRVGAGVEADVAESWVSLPVNDGSSGCVTGFYVWTHRSHCTEDIHHTAVKHNQVTETENKDDGDGND